MNMLHVYVVCCLLMYFLLIQKFLNKIFYVEMLLEEDFYVTMFFTFHICLIYSCPIINELKAKKKVKPQAINYFKPKSVKKNEKKL